MSYSSDLRIASPGVVTGTIAALSSAVPTFIGTSLVGGSSYPWIDLGVENENRYRGISFEFVGGATADASFASPVIYGYVPVASNSGHGHYYLLGTAVLTTGATALDASVVSSAYGITVPVYPATTIVSYTEGSYSSGILSPTAGITPSARSASSDMMAGVISLPYLEGLRYIVIDPGLSTSSKKLGVLYRLIGRDAS